MPQVYSYIRFSHSRQNQGESVRRQWQKTVAYCERNNLTLSDLRLSDLGVSAFRGKNAHKGALREFLNAVQSGRIPKGSILIIENLDRLSREDIDDSLPLFQEIIRSGIDIVTLEPERHLNRESLKSIVAIMEVLLYFSRANEESKTKSYRISHKWEQHRREARESKKPNGKRCPWWVEFKDGAYHLVPERAAVVKKVFQWKIDGHGIPTITKKLNAIPGLVLPRFAKSWNLITVNNMLKSRSVLGEYQPNKIVDGVKVPEGEIIPDFYPRVITLDQFHQVQETLRTHRRGRSPNDDLVNIVSGMVLNGNDGHPVYVYSNTQTHKGKKYVYHNMMSCGCFNSVPGADRSRIRYETFEAAFLKYVKELKPADFTKGKDNEIHERVATVSGELAEQEHRIRITRDFAKKQAPDQMVATLSLLSEMEGDRRALAARLEGLKSEASNHDVDAVGELHTLSGLLESASSEEAARDLRVQIRSRIRHLVDRVVIYPRISDKRGVHYKVQFDMLVVVRYKDGSQRWFVTNHDGECKTGDNVKMPTEQDKFDAFLGGLIGLGVVFPC